MDISQLLYHPQVPLAQTKAMKYNNFLDMPYGENAIVALMCYTGFNQEDSLVVNETAIERGIFRCDSLKPYHSEIVKNPSTSQDDVFTKPDANKVTGMKQGNYTKLNDIGLAPEETEIFNNDIIIGKVSPIQPTGNNNKVYKDNSEQFKSNVNGVIDRIHTNIYNAEGYAMYNVKVRMERKPIIGDKFCLTSAHEVLTINGWKNINNITLMDQVCCLNPNNNETYFSNPTKLWEFDHQGDMFCVDHDEVNLITTMEHKMYVRLENEFKLVEAKTLLNENLYYKNHNKDVFVASTYNKITNFKGKVYCIEVPDHIFYVRLNGKPVWTGNSNRHG
jgi:DNA-directed RNA polymerase II subunit RPB2